MALDNTRNKQREIIPVILAGGSGTRLWPLSRKNYPKSLLKIRSDATLLQAILTQIKSIPNVSPPLVMGNVEYGTAIAENLKEIDIKATVLLETLSLNTATATAIAAQYSGMKTNNPLLLILPVDQYISDVSQFIQMLDAAVQVAVTERLTIFGVPPNFAATDYGYIKKGVKLLKSPGYEVEQFKEKPSLKAATTYFKSGEYFWNSGIFLFSTAAFLEELALHSPKIFLASQKVVSLLEEDSDSIRVNTHLIRGCPNISLDKAVLEKTKRLVVFPFKGSWHDLGNWDSLYQLAKKNRLGNVTNSNVLTINTQNCYLYSSTQLLVTAGINDLLVVATKDAILVASRKKQDIKKIVNYLIRKKHDEAILSPTVYQPWGYYEIVDKSATPMIKHYYVNPGQEFVSKIKGPASTCWLIVKGKAQITIGRKVKLISKNQSIEITHGKKFKVYNVGDIPLHFIEIYSKGGSISG
jgi:mannose-1-phosphate guanylyltransferase